MFKTQLSVIVAAFALTACTFDQGGLETPAEPLQQRLGTRETLTLDETSAIGFAAEDGNGNALPEVTPGVRGGAAVLRSTRSGLLLLEDLDVYLQDVYVPPGVIHSRSVLLTDLELRLGTQVAVEADWGPSGTWAAGAGTADLLLDWAVLDDGNVLPLATQRLRDAEFDIYVERSTDGRLEAFISTQLEGHLRSFGNRVELSDLTLDLNAVTPTPTVE